jgi:hypothetical protein
MARDSQFRRVGREGGVASAATHQGRGRFTDCGHGDSVKDEIGIPGFVVIGQSGGRCYLRLSIRL